MSVTLHRGVATHVMIAATIRTCLCQQVPGWVTLLVKAAAMGALTLALSALDLAPWVRHLGYGECRACGKGFCFDNCPVVIE